MINGYWKYALTGNRLGLHLFKHFLYSWGNNKRLFSERRFFYEAFKPYTGFEMFTRKELVQKPFLLDYVYSKNLEYVFLKKNRSRNGEGLMKHKIAFHHPKSLIQFMRKNKLEYLEFPTAQDPFLDTIAPKGINTINVLSYSDDEMTGEVLAASLQLSTFSYLDSLGAGGIWVNLDPKFGFAIQKGIQIFPRIKTHLKHPLTSISIENLSLYEWDTIVDEVFMIHSKLGLRGLYTFEMVFQDDKAKLLDIQGVDSIPFWLKLGNMDMIHESLPF